MKKLVSLLLALCLVLSLTVSAMAAGDTLTIGTGAEAKKFFPAHSDGTNNNDYVVVVNNLYNTLVAMQADGSVIPSLATDYVVSPDGMCYTFTLREGVKFHDGSVMTAEDVAFSLNTAAPTGNGKALLINFDRAEVVDEKTVNVYLTAPFAGFINGIASRVGVVFSKAHYEAVGQDGYRANPIGTGPYKLVSAISGDTITLAAHEEYWAGAPAIKNVYIKLISDTSTQVIALENGDIDLLMSPAISSCLMLDTSKGVEWASGASAGRVGMQISNNEGNPSANDVNFRRAVQAAINKEDVVLGAMEGYATILDIDMCPAYAGRPEGYDVVPYDIEKAKEYLAASNYNGEEFKILVQSGTVFDTVAQIIQAQLMEIGINCTVNAVDSATFTDMWYAGQYGGMIKKTNSSLVDADGFLNFYMGVDYAPTTNNQYPRTAEINELGMKGRQAQGEERKALYLEAVNIVTEEAYAVPLYADTNTLAYTTALSGVEVHPLGIVNIFNLNWK